jgi:hypothetical protein
MLSKTWAPPPPLSLLYFDLHTFSGILAADDGIKLIKVRYETGKMNGQISSLMPIFLGSSICIL